MPEYPQTSRPAAPASARAAGKDVICPHCWHPFPASECWAISKSGTDRVIPDPSHGGLRFLPSRFAAVSGNPIDPFGRETTEFACPRCHLRLERANLITEPVFISVVGAPRAGKTFLLTSAVWHLRSTLQSLGCAFEHASPRENTVLQDYGKRLFEPQDLHAIIEDLPATDAKTPPNSLTVRINGEDRRLLQPFQYHFVPGRELAEVGVTKRLLVLYDNPGQDYLAETRDGLDATRHIEHSRVILFVLNPLAEKRLRDKCDKTHPLVRNPPAEELELDGRQELVLSEAIKRATTLRGLNPGGSIGARIVVAITKSDLWPDMHRLIRDRRCTSTEAGRTTPALGDMQEVSDRAKAILKDIWPAFVSTVENADESRSPKFFPVSIIDPETAKTSLTADGRFAIRGFCVNSLWAEAPMLWWLTRAAGLRSRARGPSGARR